MRSNRVTTGTAAGLVLLTCAAHPAAAEPARLDFRCGPRTVAVALSLVAPRTARVGEAIDLTAQVRGATALRLAISGAETGSVTLTSPSLKGRVILGAAGTVRLTPARLTLRTAGDCTPVSPVPPLATIRVAKGPGPTLKVSPSVARRGQWIGLYGAGWRLNSLVFSQLCDERKRDCQWIDLIGAGGVNKRGTLTGGGLLLGLRKPEGRRFVKVGGGGDPAAYAPLLVLPDRTVSVQPTQGPIGTRVKVRGTGFDPGAAVRVTAVRWTGLPTSDQPVAARADALGAVSATLTVNDVSTRAIVIAEKDNPLLEKAQAPYQVSVENGLRMRQRGDRVTLTPVTTGPTVQHSRGALQTIQVSDRRGSSLGWSLTAQVSAFAGSAGRPIPADRLRVTPRCGAGGPQPGWVFPGPPGQRAGSAVTLCVQLPKPWGEVTGGVFTADAGLDLEVPASTSAGVYSATVTLSLV